MFFYFDVPHELPVRKPAIKLVSLSQLSFLLPHFLTPFLYLISEFRGSGWQVTRVVTKRELGTSMERLREQMEKLQLYSSHRSEVKAGMLEQQPPMAEERVRRLEGEKQATVTRAEIAERRVRTREVRSWRERNNSELTEGLSTLLNLFSSTKLAWTHSTDC